VAQFRLGCYISASRGAELFRAQQSQTDYGFSNEAEQMVFQLGKNKNADDDTVREETFRRWREASLRSQAPAVELTTPIVDDDVAAEVAQQIAAEPPPLPDPIPQEIEEIHMDSMRAVEWPDPRASLALTREPEPLPPPPAPRKLERIKTSAEPSAPKSSPTSKLAQFVSSGLSATGLLGAGKPAPAAAPAPAPRANVEVLRAVDSTPLEVEKFTKPSMTVRTEQPQLSVEDDIKRRFGSNIRSALGPGTIIEGTFSFDSPVSIEGTLIGEVRSNSVLIVGSQATVNAKVKVGSLVVFGEVHGDVESEELVEIKRGGRLEGDVLSQRLAVEDGGWFQGRSTPTMPAIPAKKAPEPQKRTIETGQFVVGEELSELRTAADRWSIE